MDEELDDWYEDTFDFDSDTAKCGLCGYWYCTCCGCDCWMYDVEDEDYEEELT